ncbi:MAG TPA: hypothetical protein VIG82_00295 [Enteractinococcus sp.]
MPGKAKAALLGALFGGFVVVLVELMAVILNDEAFFGTDRSWLLLGIGVIAFAWIQVRAYDQKKGMYADREPHDDSTSDPS